MSVYCRNGLTFINAPALLHPLNIAVWEKDAFIQLARDGKGDRERKKSTTKRERNQRNECEYFIGSGHSHIDKKKAAKKYKKNENIDAAAVAGCCSSTFVAVVIIHL